MADETLKELQARAAWGSHTYSPEFQADPRPHKHFEHAVLHIHKAGGKLAGALDALNHGEPYDPEAVRRALADVLICALRAANNLPGGPLDLAAAVAARMGEKGIGPTGSAR